MLTLLMLVALAEEPWPTRACDIPAADLARAPATTPEQCASACRERPDCGGYTFITGLDRCSLEAAGAKAFGVQMFAAQRPLVDGVRTLTAPEPDHDHAGRDLESAPRDLPDAKACEAACDGVAACVGYVYIEGYRACWLKATEADLVAKRFECATRPTPPPVDP